jgi:hypothetical protein
MQLFPGPSRIVPSCGLRRRLGALFRHNSSLVHNLRYTVHPNLYFYWIWYRCYFFVDIFCFSVN